MKRILVLYAHPAQEKSEINVHLADATRGVEAVTLVDLYAEYPRFVIDIDREQERLRTHDVIVFMHPLYWYSTPAILKEWQDLVLEYGFAYGTDGTALTDKIFLSAITAGGPEAAYGESGYNRFALHELLRPLEQTAMLCRMVYLPPFALFGARKAYEEGRVTGHVGEWVALLEALRDGRLDIARARELRTLGGSVGRLSRRVPA